MRALRYHLLRDRALPGHGSGWSSVVLLIRLFVSFKDGDCIVKSISYFFFFRKYPGFFPRDITFLRLELVF